MKTPKESAPLVYPSVSSINQWLVYGLDPSMSRTGYALMQVALPEDPRNGQPCEHLGCFNHVSHPCEGCGRQAGLYPTQAEWLAAGSVKPETAASPIWVRGKGMALHLKSVLTQVLEMSRLHFTAWTPRGYGPGLLISMEYPTPMNDFLVALNRIIHLVFFEGDLWERFAEVRVLTTNAATLRSLMGLYTKGNNKGENILKAYEFIDKDKFPSLDPDSCDGVLLAMMGRHTASILMGRSREVPSRYLTSLCSGEQKTKGNGRNKKTITAGILHRPEYFYSYAARNFTFCIRDASSSKTGLDRQTYQI